MKRKFITLAMLAAVLLTSCKDSKQENNNDFNIDNTETVNESNEINTQSLTDDSGKTLDMSFNNAENKVTINFNGEAAELEGQKPASGIWYKNDQYELRGKGNDIELKKDGKSVFSHQDNMVSIESKNEAGDVLNMTFNNSDGTLKAYLNGGEQIDLVQEKAASGIWYKNENYELRGKGNDLELKKDGKVVFQHQDDKVFIESKNNKGDVLNMTFNNSEGTLKAYLNGGEQIDLVQEKAASGIWYKNEEYELRGKADSYELSKNGKSVFKN